MEILLLWPVWVIIGLLIGINKGRLLSGFVWSLLLGPFGVLIVLCMRNLKREAAELEQKKRQEEIIRLQQAQLRELRRMRQPAEGESMEFVPDSLR